MNANSSPPSSTFSGFDDWVEVFRAGKHVDSKGRAGAWSESDLAEFVRNHDPERAPIIIGHPCGAAPRWGRAAELKHERGKLFARFDQVNPVFRVAAESGAYPNRSIQAVRTPNGWRLGHVAFLGAEPPAVAGMQPMQFAAPEGEVYEFDGAWPTAGTVARLFRSLRDWLIGSAGQDTADRVLPDWDVSSLAEAATADRIAPEPVPSTFSQAPAADTTSPQQIAEFIAQQARIVELEAQLDAEATQRRLADCRAWIEAQPNLTPAMREGAAEFMAALDDAVFEFSAGGETTQVASVQWFREFIASLPPAVTLGRLDPPPVDLPTDPKAIAQQALEFQAAAARDGRTVTLIDAVAHVCAGGTK